MNLFSSSHYRTAIIKKNVIGSLGVRIISIGTSLLLVPLTIGYISSELYGVWLTLSSIIGWIGIFDVGFTNGLKNKLAAAISSNDLKSGKIYVSTTYFFTLLLFIPVGAVLFFIIPAINWSAILNVSSQLNEQLIDVIRIVLVFFIVQMVLKTITTVIIADQKNALSSLIDNLGQVLSLLLIFILTKCTFPSLTYLALALSASPVIVLLIVTFLFYKKKYKEISPGLDYVKMEFAKDIMTLGGKFFIIQIAVLVLYQTTNIIISRVAGPESVTVYNVAFKYFSISLMVFNIILSPIWAAFTDAYTQKDYGWMNSIYVKLLKLYAVSMFVLLLMLLLSPFVYDLWLGNKVKVPFSLSVILAIYMALNVWNSIHSIIVNGIGKIKLQLYLSLFGILFNIPLALYLGKLFGVNGVVISMILFSLLPTILMPFQTKKILNKTAKGIWSK
ncbi:MAG: polysaccharide biosynthesis C-terminal domain-containing protein [Tannerella sp.]|jgi:O-antigen/teichoic acid export membrane protein|nr:polysaccharide biosynthesis C-terminal domain-containing protein [Tannerella sp.]